MPQWAGTVKQEKPANVPVPGGLPVLASLKFLSCCEELLHSGDTIPICGPPLRSGKSGHVPGMHAPEQFGDITQFRSVTAGRNLGIARTWHSRCSLCPVVIFFWLRPKAALRTTGKTSHLDIVFAGVGATTGRPCLRTVDCRAASSYGPPAGCRKQEI